MEKGSNHQQVKQKNLSLIMRHIYMHSPISRVEIAHDLGLTTATITGLVAPLLAQGLLLERVERPEENKGAGRPRVMLEFNPDAFYCCGVDIGPYQINYVITDLRGQIVRSRRTPKTLDVYARTLEVLREEIPRILTESGVPREKILGVGISLPGLIDGEADRIYDTFHEGWTERSLSAELSGILGIPVDVENNVRARAICANLVDRAVDGDPFAYFYASYGVACQMIIEGRVLYGQRAAAGEIGHTVVQPGGPVCPSCGNRGCLEAIAGEQAILARCREMMAGGNNALCRICPSPEQLAVGHVLLAQEEGEQAVNEVVEKALDYLGIALANVINLISPRAILVEGKLFERRQNREHFLRAVVRNSFCAHEDDIHIQFRTHDPDRGARAAASVVIREYLNHITL